MNIDLEIKVIKKFIVKEKQARYIQFVSSSKNRWKFIQELPHFRDFKWEIFEEVRKSVAELINQRMKMIKGNKVSCYIISEDPEIDQEVMPISDAIKATIGNDATILVFGEAEMIYFEGEPPKNSYISKIIASDNK